MKVINLEKFRRKFRVQIDGKEYEVYGLKVKDIIEAPDFDDIADEREKTRYFIDYLSKNSNIPREVLGGLDLVQLNAFMDLIRGVDVNAVMAAYEEDDKKK